MISYKDLGILILFIVIVGLGVYTFFIMHNVNAILKNIRFLQTKHLDDIDRSLSKLPNIADNIDLAVEQVKEGVETMNDTVSSVTAGTREAAEYIRIIGEIVSMIIAQFKK